MLIIYFLFPEQRLTSFFNDLLFTHSVGDVLTCGVSTQLQSSGLVAHENSTFRNLALSVSGPKLFFFAFGLLRFIEIIETMNFFIRLV